MTDVHVTPGNVHDSRPYTQRIQRQKETFGFQVAKVALDSGYLTAYNAHWLEAQGIYAVIAHRRFQSVKGRLPKSKFRYVSKISTTAPVAVHFPMPRREHQEDRYGLRPEGEARLHCLR